MFDPHTYVQAPLPYAPLNVLERCSTSDCMHMQNIALLTMSTLASPIRHCVPCYNVTVTLAIMVELSVMTLPM